ncbi:MAG: SMC family ATPase, partial [Lachnospiraceae bacterium]|nr:SMC family ATPase [Lachnospiraceae bacterium]
QLLENGEQLAALEKKLHRREEIEAAIPKAEETLKKSEEAINNEREVLAAKDGRLSASKKQLAELQEELQSKENKRLKEQLSLLRQEKDTLEADRKRLSDREKTIHTRFLTNEKIREASFLKNKELTELEENYQWVRALSDTASGRLSGKEKLMLETWIQTTWFDRIIRRANLRFLEMTDAQYELSRMVSAANNRSQSGLELEVIDHYNGTRRSVKTLSGGESFLASLSLALGLSDEVQSVSGGIQVDTMFVDEGFGSLDPQALALSIRALSGLTEGNRLVGIISHVEELKEKIDKQIIVTKEKSGGSSIRMQTV